MIESIEGKRGLPRHRPPYVAQVGLFGRPTLEQNVETLFWVRDIVEKGAGWFSSHGRRERKGLRSFSVSGRVKEPGVKLAPAGITAQELIDEYLRRHAAGPRFQRLSAGRRVGRNSAGRHGRPAARFRHARAIRLLRRLARGRHSVGQGRHEGGGAEPDAFFEDEICGQCTPCRAGTEKAVKLMQDGPWDEALLNELSTAMRDASICGLGQAAPNPLQCVFKYFRDDLAKPLRAW